MTKIWTSPYKPVVVGGMSLPALVLATAAERGEQTALIDSGSGLRVSYAKLAQRITQVASGLRDRGFGPGDVLALHAPNMPQWAGIALGAMAAGGAVTGIDPTASARELATHLADSGTQLLITSSESVVADCEVIHLSALPSLFGTGPLPPGVPDDHLAFLPYSSGTTGLPKGVRLTHRNLVTVVRQLNRDVRLAPDDTVLALPPFCHVMGFLVTLMLPLVAGSTVVTCDRFVPSTFLALIDEYQVSFVAVPPPVMPLLARSPADLRSLRLIVSGGAPLGAAGQSAVAARFPHAAVGQGWGMTETAVGATMPDRDTGTVPGSVGRVMPNTSLRVAPDGELCVRGPQVMAGYRGGAASPIDEDGWLHTGDLGRIDADGNVFVVDRLKELIKVSAHQVAPAELETLLLEHPAVADAAVIPRPDAHHGQIPVAVVVPRGSLDAAELMAWVADLVAPHKRIRDVVFVDALPRSRSGKLLRRQLIQELPMGN